jgi:hypothetical protein
MDDRQRQVAQNEAIWRAINELDPPDPGRSEDIFCECGHSRCPARLRVDHTTYERVRTVSEHFFVSPGHQVQDVEAVVEQHDGFLVVEKEGLAGAVARDTNPRS